MQSRRSLSFLSVLLLLLTQLTSALPNPVPNALEARVAGPKAVAGNLAVRADGSGSNNNQDTKNEQTTQPLTSSKSETKNGDDKSKSTGEVKTQSGSKNGEGSKLLSTPGGNEEENENKSNKPPTTPSDSKVANNDVDGNSDDKSNLESEECDECQSKQKFNNGCDDTCRNNGDDFLEYIQDRIRYEFGLIKRYGTGISSDECNKHINKIQNYIWQINQQTNSLGGQWFQGNGAQYHGQVDGVVGMINQIIDYFDTANIDISVYRNVLPPLCTQTSNWLQTSNSFGLGLTSSVSASIGSFVQKSSSFGVMISF